jgi:hypothetical protein
MAEFLGNSSVVSTTGAAADIRTGNYTLPSGTDDRMLVVVIYATGNASPSNTPGDPESWDVTYGGLPMNVTGLLVGAPGQDVRVAIAALSLNGVTPDDDEIAVDISDTGFGENIPLLFQAFVFDEVEPADAAFTYQLDTDDSPGDGTPTETTITVNDGDAVLSFTLSKHTSGGTLSFAADEGSYTLVDASGFGSFTNTVGSDVFGARTAYEIVAADVLDTLEWTSNQAGAILGTITVAFRGIAPCVDTMNCDCEVESSYETLAQLRERMLVRCGYAAVKDNPPPGVADTMDEYLRSAQTFLYAQPANGSLRTERFYRWTMTAGQRYYGLIDSTNCCPRNLSEYKVTWVGWEDLNGRWAPLTQGIPPEFYTMVNQQGFPYRYEIRNCIEIFPAPNGAYTLRVKGHFGLEAFTADSHRTTIDSEAVYLMAVGNYLTDKNKPGANNALAQANAYVKARVSGSHHTRRYVPGPKAPSPMVQPTMVQFDDE